MWINQSAFQKLNVQQFMFFSCFFFNLHGSMRVSSYC